MGHKDPAWLLCDCFLQGPSFIFRWTSHTTGCGPFVLAQDNSSCTGTGLFFQTSLSLPRGKMPFPQTITVNLQMSKEAVPRTPLRSLVSFLWQVCVQKCHVLLVSSSFGIKVFSVLNTRDVNLGACSQSHHSYRKKEHRLLSTALHAPALLAVLCSLWHRQRAISAAAPSRLDIVPADYETCQQNRKNFSASESGPLEEPSHSPQKLKCNHCLPRFPGI